MMILWMCLSGCDDGHPVARVTPRTVAYAEDIQTLLDKRCVRCHRSSTEGTGFLNLTADSSHQQLVSRRSVQRPDLMIVEPFKPDVSYLMWKLENDPRIVGYRMPYLALPMPEEEIGLVRTWILEGASAH